MACLEEDENCLCKLFLLFKDNCFLQLRKDLIQSTQKSEKKNIIDFNDLSIRSLNFTFCGSIHTLYEKYLY